METKLKRIENQIRLLTLRDWTFGLAICSGITAFLCSGMGVFGWQNPAQALSIFSIMSHSGFLRQFVLPLSCISIALFVTAFVLHILIEKLLKSEE